MVSGICTAELWPYRLRVRAKLTATPTHSWNSSSLKHHAGCDAAAEVRVAGHDDLAMWFDDLAQRLDHEDMRADEAYM